MKVRKIGGLWHWRLGSIGGSFYKARRLTVWETIAKNQREFERQLRYYKLNHTGK